MPFPVFYAAKNAADFFFPVRELHPFSLLLPHQLGILTDLSVYFCEEKKYTENIIGKREEKKMKTAVVDVGGGMRGVYASGVLDRCLKENIQFDLCIGVSAGSANLASYLSGQMGRNLFFYHCLLYTSDAADD